MRPDAPVVVRPETHRRAAIPLGPRAASPPIPCPPADDGPDLGARLRGARADFQRACDTVEAMIGATGRG